jgi:hypothetical protein
MDTIIKIPKKQTYMLPELLTIVEERLDVKPTSERNITWTDQHGTTRDIRNLTDSHAANLAGWLRDRDLNLSEKIIQGELERRCTGLYPENFDSLVENYKNHPEIWRLQIHV